MKKKIFGKVKLENDEESNSEGVWERKRWKISRGVGEEVWGWFCY